MELLWGEPMANLTSFRIGGPVACVVRPFSEAALAALVSLMRKEHIPHIFLGGGTNVLAPDESWEVLVIQMNRCLGKIIELSTGSGGKRLVHVGAGVRLSSLLRFCLREELEGVEALVGIPGSVGGAIVMNAGSKDGCIADSLLWVDLLEKSGERRRVYRAELPAKYRQIGLPRDAAVLGGCIELRKGSGRRLRERMGQAMRERRASQPMGFPSAGCIFRNPPQASAGALIEQAGLKGVRFGDAQVSEKHANWIVNRGKASAAQVLKLMEHVEQTVLNRFGIALEREVHVLERGQSLH